ncbi:permease [Haliovirga abyssi]|uniref:Permease n=1 Tax=Haliovirga abyssi TaxID=2996794 RepID=A0AAU9DPJ4_9FUSO|nr:permease [Haliovirga abyssi]BDU50353.1 hypothetical protein HLVA_09220 [Haliovirga abyssi]
MIFLYILTLVAVLISFLINAKKTKKAVIMGVKKLWKITPAFIAIIIVVSIVLYLVPKEMIVHYLGGSNTYFGMILALIIGTITVLPGPIVYPLCGILLEQGVSYGVIAAFSVSLMLVGVLSFPVESAYFGKKFAVLRNLTSLFIAVVVALVFAFLNGRLS